MGWEEIGDIMDQLGESRRELEMLARWSQAVKQIDKEITNLGQYCGMIFIWQEKKELNPHLRFCLPAARYYNIVYTNLAGA